jgi:hypothetical protein
MHQKNGSRKEKRLCKCVDLNLASISAFVFQIWQKKGQKNAPLMCCSHPQNRGIRRELDSAQQHGTVPHVKIGCAWAILGGLGETLGSTTNPQNQTWLEHADTWLSLLE